MGQTLPVAPPALQEVVPRVLTQDMETPPPAWAVGGQAGLSEAPHNGRQPQLRW